MKNLKQNLTFIVGNVTKTVQWLFWISRRNVAKKLSIFL